MQREAIDSALAAAGSKATYSGSATMIGAWWLSSEFAFLVGMIVGVAGLLVQWYYKSKVARAEVAHLEAQNLREQQEHDLRMIDLQATVKMYRSRR